MKNLTAVNRRIGLHIKEVIFWTPFHEFQCFFDIGSLGQVTIFFRELAIVLEYSSSKIQTCDLLLPKSK